MGKLESLQPTLPTRTLEDGSTARHQLGHDCLPCALATVTGLGVDELLDVRRLGQLGGFDGASSEILTLPADLGAPCEVKPGASRLDSPSPDPLAVRNPGH